MANVDFPSNVSPLFVPSAPMRTDEAAEFIKRNKGRASYLVLSNPTSGTSVIFTRMSGWTRSNGETLARRYDYDQYAWTNADGTYGAGVMTGRGVFVSPSRYVMAEVG